MIIIAVLHTHTTTNPSHTTDRLRHLRRGGDGEESIGEELAGEELSEEGSVREELSSYRPPSTGLPIKVIQPPTCCPPGPCRSRKAQNAPAPMRCQNGSENLEADHYSDSSVD